MRRSLLLGSSLALVVGSAWAAFTNPYLPPFQGQPDTEFSGWDIFTSAFGGSNLPDVAGSTSDDASVTQTTPGAIVTTTGNIYHPSDTPAFVLQDTVPEDLQEVVLQLQIVGFGTPLDESSVVLSYIDGGGQTQSLAYDDSFYQMGGAGLGEVVFTWDLSARLDVITSYRIDWHATGANHSLDAVLLDTRFGEEIGTNYCVATPNSSGAAAMLSGSGSASVALNHLTLAAEPVPAGQPGLFFYGPTQILTPFGNGFRCVGGGSLGIFRLPVENANLTGVLAHELDFGAPPTAAGQISAGSTWHFQAWFRDPAAGGAAFNLSDGLTVLFQ